MLKKPIAALVHVWELCEYEKIREKDIKERYEAMIRGTIVGYFFHDEIDFHQSNYIICESCEACLHNKF